MKYIVCAAALVLSPVLFAVSPMLTFAAENQPWAYPVAPKGGPKRDATIETVVVGGTRRNLGRERATGNCQQHCKSRCK